MLKSAVVTQVPVSLQWLARYSGTLKNGTADVVASQSLRTASNRLSGHLPLLRMGPSIIVSFFGVWPSSMAAVSIHGSPLLTGKPKATYHNRDGCHKHLLKDVTPPSADVRLWKLSNNPQLPGREGRTIDLMVFC